MISLHRADVVKQDFVKTSDPSDYVIFAVANDNWLWVVADDNVVEYLNRRVELLFESVVG